MGRHCHPPSSGKTGRAGRAVLENRWRQVGSRSGSARPARLDQSVSPPDHIHGNGGTDAGGYLGSEDTFSASRGHLWDDSTAYRNFEAHRPLTTGEVIDPDTDGALNCIGPYTSLL